MYSRPWKKLAKPRKQLRFSWSTSWWRVPYEIRENLNARRGVWAPGYTVRSGYFGISGPEGGGVDVTTQNVAELYDWTTLKQDVQVFVKQCLHFSDTDGTVMWSLGEGLHGTKPKDTLQWDYVYIENSSTVQRYIHVLEEDAIKYVYLKDIAGQMP